MGSEPVNGFVHTPPRTSLHDYARQYSPVSVGKPAIPDVVLYIKSAGAEESRQRELSFIVDSGADYTLLPKWAAGSLGFSLYGLEPREGNAVGGGRYQFFADDAWTMDVKLCGVWTEIPVRFFTTPAKALLGRMGAFDALELVFVQAERMMYARRHTPAFTPEALIPQVGWLASGRTG